VPGLRAVYAPDLDATAIEPRLNLRWALTPATAMRGGVGLYGQRPAPDETLPDLGNPALEPERALHLSLGVAQRLTEALDLELTGFHKRLDRLVAPAEDPLVRYTNEGEGSVRGLEVLLRHAPGGRFFGWLAYTLSHSVRRDGPGARTRLFDYDQTHDLSAVGRYQLTTTWAGAARLRYATGNPYTPLRGGLYDSDADAFVPYALPTNSARLDDFFQVDLRVERRWVFDA
jgi:outer membrane cobalamin receptor